MIRTNSDDLRNTAASLRFCSEKIKSTADEVKQCAQGLAHLHTVFERSSTDLMNQVRGIQRETEMLDRLSRVLVNAASTYERVELELRQDTDLSFAMELRSRFFPHMPSGHEDSFQSVIQILPGTGNDRVSSEEIDRVYEMVIQQLLR